MSDLAYYAHIYRRIFTFYDLRRYTEALISSIKYYGIFFTFRALQTTEYKDFIAKDLTHLAIITPEQLSELLWYIEKLPLRVDSN